MPMVNGAALAPVIVYGTEICPCALMENAPHGQVRGRGCRSFRDQLDGIGNDKTVRAAAELHGERSRGDLEHAEVLPEHAGGLIVVRADALVYRDIRVRASIDDILCRGGARLRTPGHIHVKIADRKIGECPGGYPRCVRREGLFLLIICGRWEHLRSGTRLSEIRRGAARGCLRIAVGDDFRRIEAVSTVDDALAGPAVDHAAAAAVVRNGVVAPASVNRHGLGHARSDRHRVAVAPRANVDGWGSGIEKVWRVVERNRRGLYCRRVGGVRPKAYTVPSLPRKMPPSKAMVLFQGLRRCRPRR